jgi:hypothetical protein
MSVYQRDKFKCRWPDCQSRNKINAHHILNWAQYPLLRFNIKNGITLCRKHHKFVTGKESDYANFLFKILEGGK